MKLIDLLVKELPKRGGWPANISYIAQDEGSATWGFLHKPEMDCDDEWMDDSEAGYEIQIGYIGDADDCNTSVVSKQQYESELAASKAVVGHNGWIDWKGGECPVDSDAIVEIKNRRPIPFHFNNDRAGDFDWAHTGSSSDIIAYRLHKPDTKSRANDDRLEQDLNECIGQEVAPAWNGTGLPPVGCLVEVNSPRLGWTQATVTAVTDNWIIAKYSDGVEFSGCHRSMNSDGVFTDNPGLFRPLRTEAEKSRDKLAASLHIAAGASPIELNGIGPLYFKLADAIISGSVFGTTFKAGK